MLNDPIFNEAWGKVEKAIHEAWADSPTSKQADHHEYKLMLSVLKNVRKSIEGVAREGKAELYRVKQPTFLGDLKWRKKTK